MDFSKYKNTVEYPTKVQKPFLKKGATPDDHRKHADALEQYEKDMIPYREAVNKYTEEGKRLHAMFKADLLEELGLSNHPKADEFFGIVWEKGHASGYSDVHIIACDLEPLLKYSNEQMRDLIKWNAHETLA